MMDDNAVILIRTHKVPTHPYLVKIELTIIRHVSDADGDALLKLMPPASTTSTSYLEKDEKLHVSLEEFGAD